SETLHYASKKQAEKAYAIGYEKGKSDALKQQYGCSRMKASAFRNVVAKSCSKGKVCWKNAKRLKIRPDLRNDQIPWPAGQS
ncbi:MAG: hypothetical protein L0Z50_33230, partial [Verrucomicrobiales bacterium]|nr:hypothetical protein [Verrucomicrobiales bacterium]